MTTTSNGNVSLNPNPTVAPRSATTGAARNATTPLANASPLLDYGAEVPPAIEKPRDPATTGWNAIIPSANSAPHAALASATAKLDMPPMSADATHLVESIGSIFTRVMQLLSEIGADTRAIQQNQAIDQAAAMMQDMQEQVNKLTQQKDFQFASGVVQAAVDTASAGLSLFVSLAGSKDMKGLKDAQEANNATYDQTISNADKASAAAGATGDLARAAKQRLSPLEKDDRASAMNTVSEASDLGAKAQAISKEINSVARARYNQTGNLLKTKSDLLQAYTNIGNAFASWPKAFGGFITAALNAEATQRDIEAKQWEMARDMIRLGRDMALDFARTNKDNTDRQIQLAENAARQDAENSKAFASRM